MTQLPTPGAIRTGIGTDVHRLVPRAADDPPLQLAGLSWPEEAHRLDGHSDADVAAHAACDALLSAAGLGDLGSNFGTADPAWAGAAGVALLGETVRRVRAAGFTVGNVSVQVIGNRPRLGTRRAEAESALSEAVGPRSRCRPRPPTAWDSPAAAKAWPRSRPRWCTPYTPATRGRDDDRGDHDVRRLELNVTVHGPADAPVNVLLSHCWTADESDWQYQVATCSRATDTRSG